MQTQLQGAQVAALVMQGEARLQVTLVGKLGLA